MAKSSNGLFVPDEMLDPASPYQRTVLARENFLLNFGTTLAKTAGGLIDLISPTNTNLVKNIENFRQQHSIKAAPPRNIQETLATGVMNEFLPALAATVPTYGFTFANLQKIPALTALYNTGKTGQAAASALTAGTAGALTGLAFNPEMDIRQSALDFGLGAVGGAIASKFPLTGKDGTLLNLVPRTAAAIPVGAASGATLNIMANKKPFELTPEFFMGAGAGVAETLFGDRFEPKIKPSIRSEQAPPETRTLDFDGTTSSNKKIVPYRKFEKPRIIDIDAEVVSYPSYTYDSNLKLLDFDDPDDIPRLPGPPDTSSFSSGPKPPPELPSGPAAPIQLPYRASRKTISRYVYLDENGRVIFDADNALQEILWPNTPSGVRKELYDIPTIFSEFIVDPISKRIAHKRVRSVVELLKKDLDLEVEELRLLNPKKSKLEILQDIAVNEGFEKSEMLSNLGRISNSDILRNRIARTRYRKLLWNIPVARMPRMKPRSLAKKRAEAEKELLEPAISQTKKDQLESAKETESPVSLKEVISQWEKHYEKLSRIQPQVYKVVAEALGLEEIKPPSETGGSGKKKYKPGEINYEDLAKDIQRLYLIDPIGLTLKYLKYLSPQSRNELIRQLVGTGIGFLTGFAYGTYANFFPILQEVDPSFRKKSQEQESKSEKVSTVNTWAPGGFKLSKEEQAKEIEKQRKEKERLHAIFKAKLLDAALETALKGAYLGFAISQFRNLYFRSIALRVVTSPIFDEAWHKARGISEQQIMRFLPSMYTLPEKRMKFQLTANEIKMLSSNRIGDRWRVMKAVSERMGPEDWKLVRDAMALETNERAIANINSRIGKGEYELKSWITREGQALKGFAFVKRISKHELEAVEVETARDEDFNVIAQFRVVRYIDKNKRHSKLIWEARDLFPEDIQTRYIFVSNRIKEMIANLQKEYSYTGYDEDFNALTYLHEYGQAYLNSVDLVKNIEENRTFFFPNAEEDFVAWHLKKYGEIPKKSSPLFQQRWEEFSEIGYSELRDFYYLSELKADRNIEEPLKPLSSRTPTPEELDALMFKAPWANRRVLMHKWYEPGRGEFFTLGAAAYHGRGLYDDPGPRYNVSSTTIKVDTTKSKPKVDEQIFANLQKLVNAFVAATYYPGRIAIDTLGKKTAAQYRNFKFAGETVDVITFSENYIDGLLEAITARLNLKDLSVKEKQKVIAKIYLSFTDSLAHELAHAIESNLTDLDRTRLRNIVKNLDLATRKKIIEEWQNFLYGNTTPYHLGDLKAIRAHYGSGYDSDTLEKIAISEFIASSLGLFIHKKVKIEDFPEEVKPWLKQLLDELIKIVRQIIEKVKNFIQRGKSIATEEDQAYKQTFELFTEYEKILINVQKIWRTAPQPSSKRTLQFKASKYEIVPEFKWADETYQEILKNPNLSENEKNLALMEILRNEAKLRAKKENKIVVLDVFHATKANSRFTVFDGEYSHEGFHFGTRIAATDRTDTNYIYHAHLFGDEIIQVRDVGFFSLTDIVHFLHSEGKLNKNYIIRDVNGDPIFSYGKEYTLADFVWDLDEINSYKGDTNSNALLSKKIEVESLLKRKINDNSLQELLPFLDKQYIFAYTNRHEDVGSTSYLVLNPEQIKSAEPIEKTDTGQIILPSKRFNLTNDDIRFTPVKDAINPRIANLQNLSGGYVSSEMLRLLAGGFIGGTAGALYAKEEWKDPGLFALAGALIGAFGLKYATEFFNALGQIPKQVKTNLKEPYKIFTNMQIAWNTLAQDWEKFKNVIDSPNTTPHMGKFIRFLEKNLKINVPENIKLAAIKSKGYVSHLLYAYTKTAKNLKPGYEPPPELQKAANDYLVGNIMHTTFFSKLRKTADGEIDSETGDLEFYNTVMVGRETITALQRILTAGLKDDNFKVAVLNSIDRYLITTYKIFTNKKYKPTIEEINAVLPQVKEMLKVDDNVMARKIVVDYLEDLKKDRIFFGGATTDSLKLDSILFARKKTLTPEWRKLLGEVEDPITRIFETLNKLSHSAKASNFMYYTTVLNSPSGFKYVYTTKELADLKSSLASSPDKLNELDAYIPLPTTREYGILGGKWVHRSVADGLSSFNDAYSFANNPVFQFLRKFTAYYKFANVVLRPISWTRNIIGSAQFVVAARSNSEGLIAAIKAMFSKEQQKELINYGITEVNYIATEILEELQKERIGADKILGSKLINTIMRFYGAPDNFYRAIAYFSAKERFSKQMNLPQNNIQVVEKAVSWTNRYTPNYSEVAPFFRFIRNLPIVNPFLTYQVESVRIAKNLLEDIIVRQDLYSLAALTFMLTLPTIISSSAIANLSEKDKKTFERGKKLTPEYRKYNALIPIEKDSKGNIIYRDITPIFAFGDLTRMLQTAVEGDWQSFVMYNPFVGFDSNPLLTSIAKIMGYDPFKKSELPEISDRIEGVLKEFSIPILPGGDEWQRWSYAVMKNSEGGTGVARTAWSAPESIRDQVNAILTGTRKYAMNIARLEMQKEYERREKIANLQKQYRNKIGAGDKSKEYNAQITKEYQEKVNKINLEYRRMLAP